MKRFKLELDTKGANAKREEKVAKEASKRSRMEQCPNCKGTGRIGNKTCIACNGMCQRRM